MSHYSQFFGLLKELDKAGYSLDRQEVIGIVTEGRKSGLTTLSGVEYHDVLSHMKHLLTHMGNTPANPVGDTAEKVAENRMRRKVISLFRDIGYVSSGKADMKRIYQWVLKYGSYHKSLNQHSRKELKYLISQVSAFAKNKLKSWRDEQDTKDRYTDEFIH